MRNRWLRTAEARKWRVIVAAAAQDCPRFTVPVRIRLTFVGVRFDPDAGAKLVLDGLVAAGIIIDDRYPHLDELTLRVRPGVRKAAPYTAVEIEAVG